MLTVKTFNNSCKKFWFLPVARHLYNLPASGSLWAAGPHHFWGFESEATWEAHTIRLAEMTESWKEEKKKSIIPSQIVTDFLSLIVNTGLLVNLFSYKGKTFIVVDWKSNKVYLWRSIFPFTQAWQTHIMNLMAKRRRSVPVTRLVWNELRFVWISMTNLSEPWCISSRQVQANAAQLLLIPEEGLHW